MGERVHPGEYPQQENRQAKAETYVIKVPKDQIYRVPPPGNSAKIHNLQKRRRSRSGCCCCCVVWFIGLLLISLLTIAIAAGVFYIVFQPKMPKYTVESVSIKDFNLTSVQSIADLSPKFNVNVRADNPNKKTGIYYEKGSSVAVSYSQVVLCNGALPVFYQPKMNVTVFQTALTGKGISLSDSDRGALMTEQRRARVPLALLIKVPARLQIGDVKTSKFTVKVTCHVTVNKLAGDAKLLSKSCKVRLNL